MGSIPTRDLPHPTRPHAFHRRPHEAAPAWGWVGCCESLMGAGAASWGLPTLVSLYFVLQDETGMQMMGQSDRPWYVNFPICVKLVCSRRVHSCTI